MSKIQQDILSCKSRGLSIEDTYIYFKDYIEFSDLITVWEENN